MILDEYVDISITNRNITYYKNKGYDFQINNIYRIPVSDLFKNSLIKINVECDICRNKKSLSFQKYNKSLSNGGYYSCLRCSHIKIERDFAKLSKSGIESKKEKYDQITKDIEDSGILKCNKCENYSNLSNFRLNRNGRYSRICRSCNYRDYKIYLSNLDKDTKRNRKKKYYRNSIHLNMWRSILKSYLFRKSLKKIDQTISLLGYSSMELKEHLQSMFDENMNWDNYGFYWHIDHIIPVSLFKDNTPVRVVNSLSNLRPLEKNKNLAKGKKLDDNFISLINEYQTYLKDDDIINKN